MADEPVTPLDYGQTPPSRPPAMRWLILLVTWIVGLAIWVAYILLIGWLLAVIFL